MNDYFTLEQAESYAFFRIPKTLIRDKKYEKLPVDAALLYGLLLDRLELSRKTTGWTKPVAFTCIFRSANCAGSWASAKTKSVRCCLLWSGTIC